MKSKALFSILLSIMIVCSSLSQTLEFTIADETLCIDEGSEITNNSAGWDRYHWDFCPGDVLEEPTIDIPINTLEDRSFGFKLVEDNGLWYGFYTIEDQNLIFRLNFGDSPENPPSVDPLGNPDGALDLPGGLDFINYGGNWYAVVGYTENGRNLGLLDFGTSLANTPTGYDIGNFGLTGRIFDVKLVEEGGDLIMVFPYYNAAELYRVNYGNSFLNTPSGGDFQIDAIPNGFFPRGIALQKVEDEYKIFIDNFNGVINQLNIGSTIFSTTFSSEADYTFASIGDRPNRISSLYDGGNYYLFVANEDEPITVLNFFDTDVANAPAEVSYTTTLNDLSGIDVVKYDGKVLVMGCYFRDGELVVHTFENICDASITSSSTEDPESVSFSIDGEKIVELTGYTSDRTEVHLDTITILNQTAPPIDFDLDNVCLNSLISFNPSNTGLSSYSWDFGDGSPVDTSPTPSHNYGATGDFTVRLDVSDGTCNNFFEQVITIYEAPPAPSYTYSSPRTCVNTDYNFTNTTVDGSYTGPLVYLWEFIDEPSGNVVATANTRDAIYAFETEGQKTVRLTSSIPGCSEVTEQTLIITPGPTANFFAASVCQDEAMQFTNTSTDATSYTWDFGDGFMSSATNPSHIFNGAGNFFVSLTAIDAEGCEDTEVIEVAVSDSPQISFDFDIPCTAVDGIQFTDLTTVDNADLVSWRWFVDDEEVSSEQSPMIAFNSTGLKNIRLDVQSSNGCESSYSEDIEVLESPTPDFLISLGCQGEASTFTDNTTSVGNPIVSWLWTVDGVNYGTQDIDHVFENPGLFDVTLEITGQNFCSETITRTVEIIELPAVSFVVDGECDNQLISATDQSSEFSDPIIARRWMLDGAVVGSGSQLILADLNDNTYELALELETQAGCVVNSTQILEINNAPESSFSSTRTFGIPGDEITFTNTSTGGISSQWLLNGEVRSSDPISETINFPIAGTYDVGLVTQNSLGCYDTLIQEILIATPEVDLAIGSFELISEDNIGKIFLEVQNFSNLPIEITEAQIILENTFTITEQIVEFIDVGESTLVSLNVGIPLTVSEPSYFCVNLSSQYSNFPDIEPVNNEKCITIDPIIRLEDPFPNPVTDQFRLKLVLNESSTASISLINSAGKIKLKELRDATDGLNNFFIDMSTLEPGIYYVLVDVQGKTLRKKVIKL